MATSPAPDAAAPPGMCPGIAAMGGGGAGGDGDGDGNGGKDGKGGNGKGKGDGASGDGTNGGAAEGDPICPITGRMFLSIYDFGLTGLLPLRFLRNYSSQSSNVAGELGHGWSHAFGWRVRVRRQSTEVHDGDARKQIFDAVPRAGESVKNGLGWALSRDGSGLSLRLPSEGLTYRFGADLGHGWHHLASVTDRNGNTITIRRDHRGVLLEIIDSVGRPIRFSTDDKGRVVMASVPTEPTHKDWMELARYLYDEDGNLASVTDAEGYTASYLYSNHLMVEHRSVSGLSYCYRYNGATADARCIESWGEYIGKIDPGLETPLPPRPEGRDNRKLKGIHHVRLTYDKSQRYTEVQNALGGITHYFGDDLGRAVKIVDPAGGVTERAFDPETGGVLQEAGASGSGPRVERDSSGAVVFIQPRQGDDAGLGRILDENGEEVSFNEFKGSVKRSRHDARGNLVFVEHPDGTHEEFTHDDRGLLRQYINRKGAVSRTWHDDMGNCIAIDHGGGRFEFSKYDYLGRRVHHTDPSQRVTEWAYDRRGEIVYKKHPDGGEVRVQYDGNRKPLVIDHNGQISRFEYGGMAWLISMTLPGGATSEFRYDPMGNRTWMRNARGQVFRVRLDQAGRCIAWENFEGTKGGQGYTVAGDVAWLETPMGRAALEYNPERELVSLELADGETVAFEYGPDGPTKIDNGSVPWEVDYDVMGRVAVDRQGANQLRVDWAGGAIASITPAEGGGLPIGYHYDVLGGLDAVTVGETTVRLDDPDGEDVIDHLGNHLVLRRRHDAGGRLVLRALARASMDVAAADAATPRDPGLLSRVTYTHDRDGNLTLEDRSGGHTIEYEYSAGNRVAVKRVRAGEQIVREERLRYDAAGTVLLPEVRFDAQMRPVGLRNEEMEYDAVGRLSRRLTDRGEWRYHWNDLDQLVRVEAPDRVVEMDYDAKGRRMNKRVRKGGALTASRSYVWANNLLLHEVDALAAASRTYIRRMSDWTANGHVDTRDGVESQVFYLQSPNGALDIAVDEHGKVVWQADQTLYGDCVDVMVDEAGVDARFANHFYDRDVDLVYSVMRWYDPRVGLFVTADPAILEGNLNPRDYATNPLREMDPCGLVTTGPAGGDGTHYPVPTPNPGDDVPPRTTSPTQTIPTNRTGAPAMSGPGAWAVGSTGANGNTTRGYADCPPGAFDRAAGFGSPNNPASAQSIVNRAGAAYGCHGCGSMSSGNPTNPNHWTCDHQPPRSSYSGAPQTSSDPPRGIAGRGGAGPRSRHESRNPGAVRLYPHCSTCSDNQATVLSAESTSDRANGRTTAASRALPQLRQNAGNAPTVPLP